MPNRTSNEKWLALLAGAIKSGEKLQTNYRWEYNGKKLGGFLMRVNRGSNEGLKAVVASMGVDFKKHSNDPNDCANKFCDDLLACTDPKAFKTKFQTRFNRGILRRKNRILKENRNKLSKIWKKIYAEKRSWKKALTTTDRINLWKEYRYNEEINPEGRWFAPLTLMGKLYSWAFKNKNNQERMERFRTFFTKKEQDELKKEGFF